MSLHVDSVIKTFDTKQVLTDIYLSCKKGEIVGLLGRNGSGKSTLLKIIFGSLIADRKFVRIDEKIVNNVADNKNLVNYLPQEHFLPNHIKISKLIDLFCNAEKAELIKNMELLKPMLDKKSKHLSGGEKRLVELYMIIYSKAKYILIDEPFNGVAPVYKEDIKDLIKAESCNKGFIITDHDYHNILDVATRVVLIHDGGIKEIKDKEDLSYWGYIS